MNNVITASRISEMLRCHRSHYWNFEVGLRRVDTGRALTIGTAWHNAMEARWKSKASYKDALAAGIKDASLGEYDAAMFSAMLCAYYQLYEKDGGVKMQTEVQFENVPLFLTKNFTLAGKIDRIGEDDSGAPLIVEYKTTSDSVAQDSQYWLRLRFNNQLYQYVCAAWVMGIDVSEVIYDVVRKPCLSPKQITELDAKGRKIVIDQNGNRVWKKKFSIPRESGSKKDGFVLKVRIETPDEFYARLTADILSRPAFYFARRQVAILEDDIAAFKAQRLTLARSIEFYRSQEAEYAKPEYAWPRSISEDNCRFCPYSSFCLQNISPDLKSPPSGFTIGKFNPELK